MTFHEAASFLRGLQTRDKISWERTRYLYYAIFQKNNSQALDPKELLPLWFDKEDEPNIDPVSEEERIKELRERAKTIRL